MEELSVTELKNSLGTKFIGEDIYVFKSVSSTQDAAKKLVEQGAGEGTVVLAETQVKGKGRLGKFFFSPPGVGIWISIILYPGFSASSRISVGLTAALAAANAVRKVTGLRAFVKWPNDVLVRSKKVAGILVETVEKAIILGAGINVNLDEEQFPVDLRDRATSISRELGKEISRISLIKEFLSQFEHYYIILREEGFSSVIEDLRALSAVIGRQVVVSFNGKKFEGQAVDMDTDGALIIRLDSGVEKRIVAGNIAII